MSNPDTSSGLGKGMIGGVFMAIIVVLLFYFYVTTPQPLVTMLYDYPLLLVGIIAIAFVLAFIIQTVSQLSSCSSFNILSILKSSAPVIPTSMIALGISSIRFCRIPIASAVSPFFSTASTSSNGCCAKQPTLEQIENYFDKDKNKYNRIPMGVSYAFYMMFAMMFGITFGNQFIISC